MALRIWKGTQLARTTSLFRRSILRRSRHRPYALLCGNRSRTPPSKESRKADTYLGRRRPELARAVARWERRALRCAPSRETSGCEELRMSIELMSLVWHRFPGKQSELLCMLAMADWCNEETGDLYPSIGTLAIRMRLSKSQARRVLHGLMTPKDVAETPDSWFVRVIGNENGGRLGSTRHYEINVDRLCKLPDIRPSRNGPQSGPRMHARTSMSARGGGCAPHRSHLRAQPTRADASRTRKEPLKPPTTRLTAFQQKRPDLYPDKFEHGSYDHDD